MVGSRMSASSRSAMRRVPCACAGGWNSSPTSIAAQAASIRRIGQSPRWLPGVLPSSAKLINPGAMPPPSPDVTDIVLLGAGHAHVEVLRRFALRPEPGVRLTLIGREPHTPYSGMLPGLIRGEYAFDAAHIDLAPLAAASAARLVLEEAVGIDLASRRLAI